MPGWFPRSGVHRVQRVQKTKRRATYTSAATVAVLPEAEEWISTSRPRTSASGTWPRSSGAGGQHEGYRTRQSGSLTCPAGSLVSSGNKHRNEIAMQVLRALAFTRRSGSGCIPNARRT